ncbi:M23 family peptidase, partial [Erwinia sp. OPT-41]
YVNQCGKLICHFPFEWEKSTIDSRFLWLKTGSEEHDPMTEEDYAKFEDHAEALCFDSGAFSSGRLWHSEPKTFIRHFRKCGWLDCQVIETVMAANTSKKNKNALDNIKNTTSEYYLDINKIMRKYNFSDANRICHFLGQGAVESGYLLSMQESSQQQVVVDGVQKGGKIIEASTYNETTELGHWYGALETEKDSYFFGKKYNSRGGYITGSYSWINGNCGDVDAQKFRGRGFKMLTGLDTYSGYWVYRGWISKNDFDKYWWDDPEYKKKNTTGMKKRPPNIVAPQKVTESAYNCIDTGGFFIACFKAKVLKIMDEDKFGKSGDDSIILKVTKSINGADKGIAERKKATKKAKEVIDDDV